MNDPSDPSDLVAEPAAAHSQMFNLDLLQQHTPRCRWQAGMRRAGVAMLLQDAAQPEILLMERARHPKDPWSGQIALPGGNQDPGDPDTLATACRETAEELGIKLKADQSIGRLDDQTTQRANAPLCVSCWVFQLQPAADKPAMRPNAEVAAAFWLPLAQLAEPDRQITYTPPDYPQPVPALRLPPPANENPALWGLTYRFVQQLLSLTAKN